MLAHFPFKTPYKNRDVGPTAMHFFLFLYPHWLPLAVNSIELPAQMVGIGLRQFGMPGCLALGETEPSDHGV